MATATLEQSKLSKFIKNNKEKLYETARQNTILNKDGKPTISKNDDWFNDDIWDNVFKDTNNLKIIDFNAN